MADGERILTFRAAMRKLREPGVALTGLYIDGPVNTVDADEVVAEAARSATRDTLRQIEFFNKNLVRG